MFLEYRYIIGLMLRSSLYYFDLVDLGVELFFISFVILDISIIVTFTFLQCLIENRLVWYRSSTLLLLTDWRADWPTADWLIDWRTDGLTDWRTDWLTDWLTNWRADWLTDWLSDWLDRWMDG